MAVLDEDDHAAPVEVFLDLDAAVPAEGEAVPALPAAAVQASAAAPAGYVAVLAHALVAAVQLDDAALLVAVHYSGLHSGQSH